MASNLLKRAKFCRPARGVIGVALIGYGVYSGNPWFYLGVVPLLMGVFGICPACAMTGQCTITGKELPSQP